VLPFVNNAWSQAADAAKLAGKIDSRQIAI
jgi:hypothetical protein